MVFNAPKGVFYNKEMTFCRSIVSLLIGALAEKIIVCDGFAATGIRGIRYAIENDNVRRTIFVDVNKAAVACARKNARKNKIKFSVLHGNISRLVFDITADFVEVDPFGTPSPYLYDVFRIFNPLKQGYLSVTATDTAVLCGGKTKPCMKNYHAKPLNNECTHENGLRILIKKIAEVGAEFNMGTIPLLSISDRHYLKTVVKVTRGAEKANNALARLGYVEYCPHCGFRRAVRFPTEWCKVCNKNIEYAGPLWLGELHDINILREMKKLNEKRGYGHREEIHNKLELMEQEIGMPPYFYDLHRISKFISRGSVPKMNDVLDFLNSIGYKAARTHFSPTAVKTDAPYEKVLEAFVVQKK